MFPMDKTDSMDVSDGQDSDSMDVSDGQDSDSMDVSMDKIAVSQKAKDDF
jgi:hypothetical protein